ncbi:hypothetical protein PWG71_16010 [Nocardiopsis sp. N85]|uniref:hypothetical protein n=1 Tax=Nocardiopsis sp. N85 TaxID=3029400 RepID=UPI00237EFB6D|nr:hypothetical protein [Nocardiopsis sp. N85]MDE3722895.1 hypothetical protein [Nocardiopsis sp. N85]
MRDFDFLVRAIVDAVVLMEMSDDDDLSPDLAADILDGIVVDLDRISAEGKRGICSTIASLVQSEENLRRREIVQQLPEGLGITDY